MLSTIRDQNRSRLASCELLDGPLGIILLWHYVPIRGGTKARLRFMGYISTWFVQPVFASHVVSQRQSEFIDDLWSGRLTEPYLAARVSRISNSHALCHSSSGPSSLVFSRGPSGATYGYAVLNATFSSEAAAAYGEEVPSLSARYRRARKAGATIKLEIVVTDVETAKRVDVKSPKLFSGTDHWQTCL